MQNSEIMARKFCELGPFLRRAFWQPLHRMMAIFHVLPLTAELIIFFPFATISPGQGKRAENPVVGQSEIVRWFPERRPFNGAHKCSE